MLWHILLLWTFAAPENLLTSPGKLCMRSLALLM